MRWFLSMSVLLVSAPACSGEVKPEKRQKDLRELERQLIERHADPFHTVSREEFEGAVDKPGAVQFIPLEFPGVRPSLGGLAASGGNRVPS